MTAVAKSTGASMARHRSVQSVGTPRVFLDAVERRFGIIEFDLAADATNSCGPPHTFYSESHDSLSKNWAPLVGNLWLNPPFSDIRPWADKCARSTRAPHEFERILLLVPASIGSSWFAEHVFGHALVLGLTGRLTFAGHDAPYPKDLLLAVYGERPGFDVWDWRKP